MTLKKIIATSALGASLILGGAYFTYQGDYWPKSIKFKREADFYSRELELNTLKIVQKSKDILPPEKIKEYQEKESAYRKMAAKNATHGTLIPFFCLYFGICSFISSYSSLSEYRKQRKLAKNPPVSTPTSPTSSPQPSPLETKTETPETKKPVEIINPWDVKIDPLENKLYAREN